MCLSRRAANLKTIQIETAVRFSGAARAAAEAALSLHHCYLPLASLRLMERRWNERIETLGIRPPFWRLSPKNGSSYYGAARPLFHAYSLNPLSVWRWTSEDSGRTRSGSGMGGAVLCVRVANVQESCRWIHASLAPSASSSAPPSVGRQESPSQPQHQERVEVLTLTAAEISRQPLQA